MTFNTARQHTVLHVSVRTNHHQAALFTEILKLGYILSFNYPIFVCL
jgi:hypothetical protein